MAEPSTTPNRAWLLAERERVRTKKRELEAQQAREQQLLQDLAEVERSLDQHRSGRRLPLLDQIRVASPCTEPWSQMVGDARSRLCLACNKQVYDISAMSRESAEAFLQGVVGVGACVKIYRRADGTVLTRDDCAVGTTRTRLRRLALAVAASGATVLCAVAVAAQLPETAGRNREPDLGKRAATETIPTSYPTLGEPVRRVQGAMVHPRSIPATKEKGAVE